MTELNAIFDMLRFGVTSVSLPLFRKFCNSVKFDFSLLKLLSIRAKSSFLTSSIRCDSTSI